MPVPLLDALAAQVDHIPLCSVWVNNVNRVPDLLSSEWEGGLDVQSSRATISFVYDDGDGPDWLIKRSKVRIDFGYAGVGGGVVTDFDGWLEDWSRSYSTSGYRWSLQVAGYYRLLQIPYGSQAYPSEDNVVLSFENAGDTDIWNALMRAAGVPVYYGGIGEGLTYGTRDPVVVHGGDALSSLVNELDSASPNAWKTFDWAGMVRRAPILNVPSDTAYYHFVEGDTVAEDTTTYSMLSTPTRDVNTRDIANQCVVFGTADENGTAVSAFEQAVNEDVGFDGYGNPIYKQLKINSRIVETISQCNLLAARYMKERNKRTDVITFDAPLVPGIMPGMTVGVTSARLGLSTEGFYIVKHVSKKFGTNAIMSLTLDGGIGDEGPLHHLPPIASFIVLSVTREKFDTGTVYTVKVDGSSSFSQTGNIVTWAWSTNAEGPNSVGAQPWLYTANFSEDLWLNGTPTITLTVTDDLGETDTITLNPKDSLIDPISGDVQLPAYYVAAYDRAEAYDGQTNDWNTWIPGGSIHVISTPSIAGGDTTYFGTDDGKIYRTDDALRTAPTLVWTAPSGEGIVDIWINENNADRLWIIGATGSIYFSADQLATGPAFIGRFQSAQRIIESIEQDGRIRVACLNGTILSQDGLITYKPIIQVSAAIMKSIALGPFHNYSAGAADSDHVVMQENAAAPGTGIPPSALTADPFIDARITVHLRDDSALIGDNAGHSWLRSGSDATLTQASDTNAGYTNDIIRIGTAPDLALLAGNLGVFKTTDWGQTWGRLREYNGTTTKAMRIGYGNAPTSITPIPFSLIVESSTDSEAIAGLATGPFYNGLPVEPGPNYTEHASEQSCTPNTFGFTDYGPGAVAGHEGECGSTAAAAAYINGLRNFFDVPDGVTITSVTLTWVVNDQWVSPVNVSGTQITDTGFGKPTTGSASIDPSVIKVGQRNYIAVAFANASNIIGNDYGMGVYYKLEIS